MRMLKTLGAAIFAAALPCLAVAQTNPNLTNMQVLTPGQWNNLFASKQDTLGFTPMNSNGGTFLGRIVTAPPGASTSGLNLTPGTTPGSPANGDIWFTASSIFARVNGVTVDLVGSPCTNCALTTLVNTFTASPQTVQGLTTTQPGWFAQLTGDTNARVRVGLNSTDIPSIAFGPGNAVRDAFIERLGAGSLRFGTMDAAAPVAQTFSVQNVLTGTSNTAGAGLTIAGSRGTGTGAGGNVLFQVAPAGSTGSAQNALVNALSKSSTGSTVVTSADASCFAVGPNGTINSALNVVCSTATLAAGVNIIGAVSGGTVAVRLTDPGSNTSLSIDAKGTGTITLNGTATGGIIVSRALTYGGVALSNSVTGIGSMVLSAAPTITGHPTIEGVTSTGATGTGNLMFGTGPAIAGGALSGTFSGTPTLSGANFVTLANIVQDATAWSLLGNATSGTANYAPFTIGGLTSKASIAGTDLIMISDQAAGGALKQVTVSQVAAGATVSSIAGNTGAFTLGVGLTNLVNDIRVSLTNLTNSLGADVALSILGTFFDGPSIAQGTSGTWNAYGSVTILDTTGAADIWCKLWDGTSVIDSGYINVPTAAGGSVMGLSGNLASPAGNIRISCRDGTHTTGLMKFNASGAGKDSTVSAHRIQ